MDSNPNDPRVRDHIANVQEVKMLEKAPAHQNWKNVPLPVMDVVKLYAKVLHHECEKVD